MDGKANRPAGRRPARRRGRHRPPGCARRRPLDSAAVPAYTLPGPARLLPPGASREETTAAPSDRQPLARARPAVLAGTLALACACSSAPSRDPGHDACPPAAPALDPGAAAHAVRTVFVVVMENEDWSSIAGNPSAPYVNGTLLPRYAHAVSYRNGGLHPSLGNYVALEAGDPLGVYFDASPSAVPLPVSCHLVTYLEAVGLSWKAYEEGIGGTVCPVADAWPYAARHDPFVYFEDVSGRPPGPGSARCVEHVRPYAELAADLASGSVARYNFVTPDLCHDGHDSCPPLSDPVRQADAWLEAQLPVIMASRAYQEGGAILVTWDEGGPGDQPIGMIVVSPFAKPGYAGSLPYSHASTLRTVQEVLGVTPLLRGAAAATSLADLFATYP